MHEKLVDYSDFPVGPTVKAWLELPETPKTTGVDAITAQQFENTLIELINSEELSVSNTDLIELIDELVAMNFPNLAADLCIKFEHLVDASSFRFLLSAGVATMLIGENEKAQDYFHKAQKIYPDEPASYVNMAQILLSENQVDTATQWLESGLNADHNNFNLWGLLGECYYEKFGESASSEIANHAHNLNSWAGLCLSAEMNETADQNLKLSLLEPLYKEGERDNSFLVEYTAALGVAGKIEEIPTVIWQAENNNQSLPWQLYLHAAQAHLSLEQPAQAKEFLEKAKCSSDIPQMALEEIHHIEKDYLGANNVQ